MRTASKRPSPAYFYLGSLILTAFFLQTLVDVSWPELEMMQSRLPYKIVSGALLAFFLVVQWRRSNRAEHRIVGILGPLILYLHASSLGFGSTFVLSTLFLANVALGLVNRETLGIKARWYGRAWLALHITLAITVLALGGLHVWTALYYE
jgi:methionine sulfoxide reductase heme-binding subunit